jgi:hypothetical protein
MNMDILLERMLSLIPKKPDGKYVHGAKKLFCEKIGAPTNIISEWESNKTKSYRNYVHAAAMAYNVSVEWLKGETDEKEKSHTDPKADEAVIADLLDRMSPSDLADLMVKVAEKMKARGLE